MSSLTEKRYFIDAGEGVKRDTCPSYSYFEDGRDAKSGIIPPKGYLFTGFNLDLHSTNKDYDGRLIAEYERAPLSMRLGQHKGKFFIALLVIGLVLLYYLGFFSKPKPQKTPSMKPLVATDSLSVDARIKSDSTAIITDSILNSDNVPAIIDPKNQKTEQEIESSTDTIVFNFQQEFWKMIHDQSGQMDSYDALFNKYKGAVKCKEYDYLRGTILQNTTTFKSWKGKLLSIPASELQSITTIDALKQKLK